MSTSIASAPPAWRAPASSQSSYVILPPVEGESVWVTAAGEALAKLRKLPPNWDGYGSGPVTEAALGTGMTIFKKLEGTGIPLPTVVPATGGGFALEFQVARKRLELEVLPDGAIEYLTIDKIHGHIDGDMREGSIPANCAFRVVRLGNWLVEL